LREAELQGLAAGIVDALLKKGLLRPQRNPAVLQHRIVDLIAQNLEEERALREEAERLADAHARKMVGMDHRRIVQGIMERLARERGFDL
jgi:hypothetical protein